MSSQKLHELQEKLLPAQNNGASFSSSWSIQSGFLLGEQSTSRSVPNRHLMPSLQEYEEPTCIQKQTDYLRSLTETVTDDNFPEFPHSELGQSSQSGVSPDQMDSILEAITSGQEFPGSSSSTSLTSSSSFPYGSYEMLPTSSLLCFGNDSVNPISSSDSSSYSDTPPLNSPYGGSQQPIMTSAGITRTTSDHDCVTANDVTKGVTGSGHEVSDLVGVNPFDAGTEIDIQRYLMHDLEVNFHELENRVFEKQQSRKDKQARQRIINGKVKFMVRSDRQVKELHVWVRREVKAAQQEKDANGMVPIKVVFLRKDGSSGNLEYQADLDSVYKVEGSDRPVFKLAKVHTQERNLFELLVQVVFANNEVSEYIKSKPFLIKTKRINEEPALAEPVISSKQKRKRPNTCPSSSVRGSSQGKNQPNHLKQHTLQNEPDSTGSMSPLSACSVGSRSSTLSSEGPSQLDHLVVKHLNAQQANIEKLSFGCMMQTSRGDIAYHLRLTNPDIYQTLEEGVVVGFFPDDEGPAMIEPLSNDNASHAVMAGVISRSAYVEAHAPLDKDKGKTDIVCVIGMVKVQIVGSVKTGERIYASTDKPGTGIPESHLPLGAFILRPHTLLGMAMEKCKPRHHDEVNLVKCFVCIVLGINSHQLSSEVENIMENIDMDIKVAIGKSNKTTCRRMYLLIFGFITFLGLLGFFLYELLTPGSLFRYFLCRIGSCSGPHLICNFTSDTEDLVVDFIPFVFLNLKGKIPNGEILPTKLNTSSATYYLNDDRCAYGGRTDASKFFPEKMKAVRGPTYLASYKNCSKIFSFQRNGSGAGTWKRLHRTAQFPDGQLSGCSCNSAKDFVFEWIVLLLSFTAYCSIILF